MSKNTPTGQNAVILIEAEAASYGAIRTTDATGRVRFEVTCGACSKQNGMFNPSINHADQVLTHFRKQGWIFNHHMSPYCSTPCFRSAKQIKKDDRRIQEMKHPTVVDSGHLPQASVAPPSIITHPTIEPSAKISRRVITLLNDHFDTDKRLYAQGWSDERVRLEADASLEFVIKTRKDAYAELAEDPETTKMRQEIKSLEELVNLYNSDIQSKLEELKLRMDKLTGVYHKAQG